MGTLEIIVTTFVGLILLIATGFIVVAVSLSAQRKSEAVDPVPPIEGRKPKEKYFTGEKIWLWLLMGVGVALLITSCWTVSPVKTGITTIWSFLTKEFALGLAVAIGVIALGLLNHGGTLPPTNKLVGWILAVGAIVLVGVWIYSYIPWQQFQTFAPNFELQPYHLLWAVGAIVGIGTLITLFKSEHGAVFIVGLVTVTIAILLLHFLSGYSDNNTASTSVPKPKTPAEAFSHYVTVSTDEWTPIPWVGPSTLYRELACPREAELVVLIQDEPPTERDIRLGLFTKVPVDGLRPSLPIANGQIMWVKVIPNENGDFKEFKLWYRYVPI